MLCNAEAEKQRRVVVVLFEAPFQVASISNQDLEKEEKKQRIGDGHFSKLHFR